VMGPRGSSMTHRSCAGAGAGAGVAKLFHGNWRSASSMEGYKVVIASSTGRHGTHAFRPKYAGHAGSWSAWVHLSITDSSPAMTTRKRAPERYARCEIMVFFSGLFGKYALPSAVRKGTKCHWPRASGHAGRTVWKSSMISPGSSTRTPIVICTLNMTMRGSPRSYPSAPERRPTMPLLLGSVPASRSSRRLWVPHA